MSKNQQNIKLRGFSKKPIYNIIQLTEDRSYNQKERIFNMPRKSRDDYFQECLDHFCRVKLGEEMSEHAGDLHPLSQWTIQRPKGGRGREKTHVYSVVLPKEITVGYIERNRLTEGESIKMRQYVPEIKTILCIFQDTFSPFELWEDNKCVSSARIIGAYEKDETVKLVILVRYYNDYMPFFADTPTNRTMSNMKKKILVQDIELQHYKDEIYLLKNNEEVLGNIIDGLITEKITLNAKLAACKYERKLRELYCAAGTLEQCPCCIMDIQKENLFIPPCAHFLCSPCAQKCRSCPICRGRLDI